MNIIFLGLLLTEICTNFKSFRLNPKCSSKCIYNIYSIILYSLGQYCVHLFLYRELAFDHTILIIYY